MLPGIKFVSARAGFESARRSVAAVIFSAASLVAGPVHANFSCTGPVSYLAMNSNGVVYVATGSFGVWAICQVSAPFVAGGTTVAPDTCKSWYAGLMAAKHVGTSVTTYYESSAAGSNGPACSALGSWVVSIPYHLDF